MASKQTDLLVRAFKASWTDYYQFGRDDAISPETARPALAQFLVDKAREGIDDEAALASAGLDFLFSMEAPRVQAATNDVPASSVGGHRWSMRLESVSARFVRVVHIRRSGMRLGSRSVTKAA